MAGSATLNVAVLVNAAQAAAGLNQVGDKAESVAGKMGKSFAKLAAGLGILDFAKTSIESLNRIERINAQTEQAIKSTGGAANVSAQHIEDLAGSLENLTATEAETTQEGANLLLTFTNVKNGVGAGNDVFDQATRTLVDMSRALGQDMSSSAVQLGKALNDPIKGITALSRVGVSFTEDQKAMITSLVETGDVMGAQKIILAELTKEFGGSGEAFAKTTAGQIELAKHALGTFGEDVLSTVIPVLGMVATTLGTLLNGFVELPGPIKAVALAIGGLVLASTLVGTKVATAFGSVITAMTGAGSSVNGFKASLASIGKALSGGALVLGAAAIFGAIAIQIQRTTDAANKGKSALEGYIQSLVSSGGKSTDATAAAFRTAVTTSDAFTALIEDGFSASESVDILSGTIENWHGVMSGSLGTVHNLNRDTAELVNGFIDANGAAGGLAQAQLDAQSAMGGSTDATNENTKALADEQAAAAAAADAQKDYEDALKAAQQVAATTAVSSMLDQAKSDAEDAARAVDLVRVAMEQLDGRLSNEAAVANWSRSFEDAKKSIEGIKTAGESAFDVQALKDWNVAQLQIGDANQTIYDSLTKQAAIYPDLIGQTFEAAGGAQNLADATGQAQQAANTARGNFIELAQSAGLTNDEAAALATKLGILDATQISPKLFEVLAQDDAARAAVEQLQASQIGAKNFEITAGADGAMGTVDDLITYTDAAGSAMPPVPIHATAAPADAVVNDFTGQKLSTPESFISVRGNINPFQETITRLMSQQRDITVNIFGNINPWQATITGLMSQRRDVTIDILGNTTPVLNAIRSVTNGSYTATVNVTANTSSASAAIAAVPRSVTVAPAAPRTSFAAPTLAPLSTLSSSSSAPSAARNVASGTVVINISGAIDPDSTARQVEDVLRRRDRRTGGIAI